MHACDRWIVGKYTAIDSMVMDMNILEFHDEAKHSTTSNSSAEQ